MDKHILISFSLEEFQKIICDCIRAEQEKSIPKAEITKTEFISRKKTAIMLGISLVTLNDYCKRGLIPTYRIGNRVLFIESEIIASVSKVKTIKHMRGEVDL
jgi:predicted DNA-binding transcriptional regulator AlpA